MSSLKDIKSVSGNFIPPGVIMPFGGATAPSGWLICNTATGISTTTYAALYAAIGYAWGNPGGGLFNLPNLRGRFPRGVDKVADGTAIDPDRASRAASNAGGNINDNVGSVQDDRFQGHFHQVDARTTPTTIQGNVSLMGNSLVPDASVTSAHTIQTGAHGTPRVSTETRPLNAYVNYIIKY